MEEIISYAKTVLFFLLFVNLLMQLLQGSSYERFVRPVCGMILVILILRPVLGMFGGEEKVLYAAEQKMSLFMVQNNSQISLSEEDGYEFAVLEEYEKELTVRLSELMKEEGLTVTAVDFSLSAEEKDFGTIRGITMTAEKGTSQKNRFFQMEPIVFEREKREETVSADEIRIKDKLADFYNLEEGNIYVSIKEEEDG